MFEEERRSDENDHDSTDYVHYLLVSAHFLDNIDHVLSGMSALHPEENNLHVIWLSYDTIRQQ
jgi:hypothetical protein